MNERDADNLATLRRSIPESSVQAAIIEYMVLKGACVIRVNGGTMPTPDGDRRFVANTWYAPGHRRETRGTADIVAMWNGEAFAIEVKRVGGRQSPEQRAFQAAWEEAGGWYILASSVDDVMRELGVI